MPKTLYSSFSVLRVCNTSTTTRTIFLDQSNTVFSAKEISMNVTRSTLMLLNLQNPSTTIRYHRLFFSHFTHALRNPTSPPSLFNFKPRRFFSLTPQLSAVPSSEDSKGRDTFFAEDNVLWTSLGLSDTLSRSLSNIGLIRPSLVQVPIFQFVLSFCFSSKFIRLLVSKIWFLFLIVLWVCLDWLICAYLRT